jgi:hypothetical protein
MRTPRPLAALAATTVALATLAALPADAAAPTGKTLARHLVGPLSLAVDGGDVYVTQNFAGVLNRLRPGKDPKVLYASRGGNEVGGVSARRGTLVFAETASNEDGEPVDSWLKVIGDSGRARTLAHLRAYEERNNPDGAVAYGISDLDEECAAQWPTEEAGPPSYTGVVDSHPFATYQTKKRVYVADAGMNAVLAVARGGHIRTVAVTPAVPVEVTQELATANGLPDCAVGHTYVGESVPTDVERGPGGKLYVSTEGGGLGEQLPLGSVYRINPKTGRTTQLADQLMTPTGLAVTKHGGLLVAELFGNRIARIRQGTSTVRRFVEVGLPGAVEITDGDVYATTNVLPPEEGAPDGRVVRYR